MTDPCAKCGGTGRIPIDEYTVRMCICAYAKLLRKHLGDTIALVKTLDKSPLYAPDQMDRTKENLILKGDWQEVVPHLKWALSFKGLKFPFKLLRDIDLLDVWLGKRRMFELEKGNPHDYPICATVTDLMEPSKELVIIRFGFLHHRNKAMASVLLDALRVREHYRKPTWLIEEPDLPFGEGHPAWTYSVGEYLDKWYQEVPLEDSGQRTKSVEIEQPIEDVSLDDAPVRPVYVKRRPAPAVFEQAPTAVVDDDDLGCAGSGKKKKWR